MVNYANTDYYDNKKKQGLIFTQHLINRNLPYIAMRNNTSVASAVQIDMPGNILWWSSKFGRYRNCKEQAEYLKNGFVDKDPIAEDNDDYPDEFIFENDEPKETARFAIDATK